LGADLDNITGKALKLVVTSNNSKKFMCNSFQTIKKEIENTKKNALNSAKMLSF